MDFAIPMVVRTADLPEDMVGKAVTFPPPWQPDLTSSLGAVRVGAAVLAAGAVAVGGVLGGGVLEDGVLGDGVVPVGAVTDCVAVGGGGADPSAGGAVRTSPPNNAAVRIAEIPLRRRITDRA